MTGWPYKKSSVVNSLKLGVVTSVMNEALALADHLGYLNYICSKYDAQYVIADGGSSDGSISIASKYIDEYGRIILNSGSIYNSWNLSLNSFDEDVTHFVFLGVGDKLYESFLTYIFDDLYGDANIDVLTSAVKIGSKNRTQQNVVETSYILRDSKFACMPFHHSGTIFNRRLFNLIGDFDIKYTISSDLDWIIRMRRSSNISIGFFPEVGVCLSAGGVSTGGQHALRIIVEEFHICLNHKRIPCPKRILYLLYSYFFWRCRICFKT